MRAVLAFLLAVGLISGAFAQEITGPQPTLPQSPLLLQSADGNTRFIVELANEWPQQQAGLMFRENLAPNAGMLFDFVRESSQAFWMKNTLIPLDLLFIKADGTIVRITGNATPLSTDSIPSYEPVRAVLEIAGGRAAEIGVKAGDKVLHPIFGNVPRAPG